METRNMALQKTSSAMKVEIVQLILFVVVVAGFPCLSAKDNFPSNSSSSYIKHTYQMKLWDDSGLKTKVVVEQ